MKRRILSAESDREIILSWVSDLPLKSPGGRPYVVEIKLSQPSRTPEQIKRHWARMQWLSINQWISGRLYDKDAWDEYLKQQVLGKIETPGGWMAVPSPKGSKEYAEFDEAIDRYLSENYGIWIPDLDE